MMEFMIVDDHTRMDSKGLINHQKRKENESYNELIEKLDPRLLDQVELITISTSTNLSSYDDHNYTYYSEEFKRVVKKHIEKIKMYRNNHPDYQLIFFIQDESSMYVEVNPEDIEAFNNGEEVAVRYHYPFMDYEMVGVLVNADIDYVVWWMPYRIVEDGVPTLAIIKPKELKDLIHYPKDLILSSEE